jgi:hypothetical protein
MLKTTKKILVLGGSGYIGQRIVTKLQDEGHTLRVMTRRPHMAHSWLQNTQIITGDALSGDDLQTAMTGITHVVVCIRLWENLNPKADANMALQILHTANRVGIHHLTWVSERQTTRQILRKIIRSQKGSLPVFFLQSGPVVGSGSLAKEVHEKLAKYPAWLRKNRQGSFLVPITRVLETIAQAIKENKTGYFSLPQKSTLNEKKADKTTTSRTKILEKVSPILWQLILRLPHKLGPWIYQQLSGTTPTKISFTPDSAITWREALSDIQETTWSAIPFPMTTRIHRWITTHFSNAHNKTGYTTHGFRLVYQHAGTTVWQSTVRYPLSIRVTTSEKTDICLLPKNGFGWIIGKTIRFFFHA